MSMTSVVTGRRDGDDALPPHVRRRPPAQLIVVERLGQTGHGLAAQAQTPRVRAVVGDGLGDVSPHGERQEVRRPAAEAPSDRCPGTAISSPTASSASGRQPSAVSSGCDAVRLTRRPEAVRTSNTGLTPSCTKALTVAVHRRPSGPSACTEHEPRAAARSASSATVTTSPVTRSTIGVSQATHFPIAGRAPTMLSVDGWRPDNSSSMSW